APPSPTGCSTGSASRWCARARPQAPGSIRAGCTDRAATSSSRVVLANPGRDCRSYGFEYSREMMEVERRRLDDGAPGRGVLDGVQQRSQLRHVLGVHGRVRADERDTEITFQEKRFPDC